MLKYQGVQELSTYENKDKFNGHVFYCTACNGFEVVDILVSLTEDRAREQAEQNHECREIRR